MKPGLVVGCDCVEIPNPVLIEQFKKQLRLQGAIIFLMHQS
jgi:hypothetical protein